MTVEQMMFEQVVKICEELIRKIENFAFGYGETIVEAEALKRVVKLAKEYIGIKGLPEEKELIDIPDDPTGIDSFSGGSILEENAKRMVYNQALHLCKLAVVKGYVRKDKIEVDMKKVESLIQKSKIIKFLKKVERHCAELEGKTFDDPKDMWLGMKIKELTQAFVKADIIKVDEA